MRVGTNNDRVKRGGEKGGRGGGEGRGGEIVRVYVRVETTESLRVPFFKYRLGRGQRTSHSQQGVQHEFQTQ